MSLRSPILLLILCFYFTYCQTIHQEQQAHTLEQIDWSYAEKAWKSLPQILEQIQKPVFKQAIYNIVDFGAIANDTMNNKTFIQQAINTCHKEGGGTVNIPPGIFLTGALRLKSNVNLHLEKGATLSFSTDPKDYLPVVKTHWEGMEIMNFQAPIFSSHSKNLAITGEGVIDGNASFQNWWQWSKDNLHKQAHNRPRLMTLNKTHRPVAERVFGEGHNLRPNFIQFYKCKSILIQGVTIRNSPMWNIHTILSENIIIDGITVEAPYESPNTDALDFESSKNILVENSTFDVGDDCITIKSGRNQDGRRINTPTENLIARHCYIKNGRGGIVIGSEITGGARNIFMENCKMDSPNLNRAVRIKSSEVRGGHIENVFVRNLEIGEVGGPILNIDLHYGVREAERTGELFIPSCENIFLENIICKKADHAWYLDGYEDSTIKNVFLKNIEIKSVAHPIVQNHVENVNLINVSVNATK